MRDHVPPAPVVIAGYLSHRLPVHRVIVLRCHPTVLADRLRGRGGDPRERRENVECEALDTIAGAARAPGRTVFEIDTTHASPETIARKIRSLMAGTPPSAPRIDWLSDPTVPPLLLSLGR
jgi:adenylate kinase